ncbi:hypothetical protein EAH69_01555 [Faecalibacter macacae]|uniref:Uncharacterized protein n=2 Tax=Faecalibacter macacae TaxID=1859289 RepID=A0A3L9MGV9_9FLAO|nr:hypothetical protein EAH69_01555 [Faecalibacter macacae]
MKNFIYIIFFMSSFSNAQMAIGKPEVSGSSTLLDFDDSATNTKGILLPTVTDASTVPTNNGTFIYDILTKQVKMYENDAWINLTSEGNTNSLIINSAAEKPGNTGVIIGSETSPVEGILVLESSNKAMILPKIADPHLNVKSPYPGMMCYDTVSNTLAVFDGSNWNYWK